MNLHESYFCDFLERYEYVILDFLQSALSPEVALYVVIAHIVGIISISAFGVNVKVEDHTEALVFGLRGEYALHFYEEHLRSPEHPDPISDPYALNASWFVTYLFRIDLTRKITINGRNGFVVPQICMKREIVYQFVLYQLDEEEYQCYREAFAVAIPSGPGYENNGLDISPNRAGCVGLGIGFRKHIYARPVYVLEFVLGV